ncbi:MAG: hypothetical protein CMP57_02060 [Flavobacteriales bacterium]|nr:hypothetical protein [Flavobacteriales bacterium]|tara:strand:- start:4802 stop:5272 length:471 start_codon:yes stop_codon:yes gene_type:complete
MSKKKEEDKKDWTEDPEIQDFLDHADKPGPWPKEYDKVHTVGGLTADKEGDFMKFQNKINKSYKKRKSQIERFIKGKNIKKTITWRIISLSVSFLIVFFVTGSLELGGLIAVLDTLIKSGIFYFHEISWNKYTTKKIKSIKLSFREPIKNYDKDID